MNKRILLIHTNFSSFVRTDYEILSLKFMVDKYHYSSSKGILNTAFQLLKQFIFLLLNIRKYDLIYIWFADYHSLLPVLFAKLFSKKSFVVIGGYDAARIPALNYGALRTKLRSSFVMCTINNCTLNLSVSKHINRKIKWIAPKANFQLIYNCVKLPIAETNFNAKENLVITVGLINSERNIQIKGIDTFIKTAQLLPSAHFKIIGVDKDNLTLFNDIPDNVEIIGFLDHEQMIQYLQKAKVYCQLSRTESFGVALAEAMFYNCVPVVTNVGGLPEVIGDTGYIVKRNEKEIAEKISQIFLKQGQREYSSKTRIKEKFDLSIRTKKLLEIIDLS
ncbi:glycosyltransferase family 4 protein [uncultured Draconibacterium sp.]|uniref:glycosyltransferase family 4 protein n=1 Tax=uncultured Draconibacterium sp. TaxID=1573823 RepID=UPI002AA729B8|nr:glycosyltransferase family 4 protein [uncultured Draconibacterium sp.]